MPWTVSDVDRHKKGLTPAQKKKWVSVANGILRDCKAKGGKDCEGKAIRIANSKFEDSRREAMNKKMEKIPKGALCLLDTGNGANAFAEGEDGKKKLNMLAYSGKIIKGHWWWGDLSIDCSGVSLDVPKFPILENHDRTLKIAFSSKPIINNEGIRINPDKTKFVSTEESEEFQKLSGEGFPYQASISARPTIIERLEDGEKAKVNGYTFKGPGTIWRKSTLKEASVVVFGFDSQTSARAFSRDPEEGEELEVSYISSKAEGDSELNERKEVTNVKNIEELKEKYPDLVKQLQDSAVEGAKVEFKKTEGTLQAQITGLSGKVEEQSTVILNFQKKEEIRTEKELAFEAKQIWDAKLASSEIPERLYDKVSRHVNVDKFVKEDIFDREKFGEAVDKEIKDWESRGATSTVLGKGTTEKELEEEGSDSKFAEENKTLAKGLLERAGQKQG